MKGHPLTLREARVMALEIMAETERRRMEYYEREARAISPSPSEELRALARRVLQSLAQESQESIEAWAWRLANDVAKADD